MKHFYQVINRRALRDRLLQQAVMSAFRQSLLPGQFPALVLYLEVDPATIDVNSHPTKTEVRFTDPGYIFRRFGPRRKSSFTGRARRSRPPPERYQFPLGTESF